MQFNLFKLSQKMHRCNKESEIWFRGRPNNNLDREIARKITTVRDEKRKFLTKGIQWKHNKKSFTMIWACPSTSLLWELSPLNVAMEKTIVKRWRRGACWHQVLSLDGSSKLFNNFGTFWKIRNVLGTLSKLDVRGFI